ncbi:PAS domain S-box protein [archaeon]|nr:MAG: PAS domain S-box protein [archaeon]
MTSFSFSGMHDADDAIKILLVDDDEDLLTIAKHLLEKDEPCLSIDVAKDGEAAYALFMKHGYEAVVSDYQMPKMDGLELLRRIRENDAEMPFILFTGKGREEVAIEALNHGANRYIQKKGDPSTQYALLKDAIVKEVRSKRAHEALRESEHKFRTFTELAPVAIMIHMDERWVYVNPAAKRLIGRPENDIVGSSIWDIVHPDHRRLIERRRDDWLCGKPEKDEVELKIICGQEIKWAGMKVRPITYGDKKAFLVVAIEITERKRAEKALKESENRFQRLIDQAPMGIVRVDLNENIVEANRAMNDLLGYGPGEIQKKNPRRFVHPADMEIHRKNVRFLLEGKEDNVTYELRIVTRNGDIKWVRVVSNIVDDDEGRPLFRVSMLEDITAQKEAEERLHTSQVRLNTAMEKGNIAWWEMELPSGRVKFDDKKARMLGHAPERFKTYTDFMELVHPEDHERVMEDMRSHLEGRSATYDSEYRILTARGDWTWFEDRGGITRRDEGGRPTLVTGIVIDISERKEAEEEVDFLLTLLRHDLKNKTHIIQSYLDLINLTSLDDDTAQYIERAASVNKVGQQLLEKVGKLREIEQATERRPVNIDRLLTTIIKRYEAPANERGIEIEHRGKPSRVEGGELLEELFSNLIENAIIHSKGSLIRISIEEQNGETRVSMEDDGRGIGEKDLVNLFNKGFKGRDSKGLGIGTYLIKKIAEAYGGRVRALKSDLGGARFDVYLRSSASAAQ